MPEENNVQQRLAELMWKVENPKFNKTNPHFGNDYADLAEELKVKELTHIMGFRIHQTVRETTFISSLIDNATGTVTLSVTTPFVLDKQTTQGLGSALTYHRRYGIDLLFNRVGQVDDDGEAAEGRKPKAKRAKKTTETVKVKENW